MSDVSSNVRYGVVAMEFGGRRLPLQVLKSAAGFYIGTYDDKDGPVSRESAEYYATKEEASAALVSNTFTQREHP